MNLYSLKKIIIQHRSYIYIILIIICGYVFAIRGDFGKDAEKTKSVPMDNPEDTKSVEDAKIIVYITGAVKSPGVYEVTDDTRLYELIEEAGGLLECADISGLNLASVLTDGQKINVKDSSLTEHDDGLININTADVAGLSTLPGIGESRAMDIIRYREENGTFSSIEDIMKVSGIKESLFQKIKDRIKTD